MNLAVLRRYASMRYEFASLELLMPFPLSPTSSSARRCLCDPGAGTVGSSLGELGVRREEISATAGDSIALLLN